MKYIMKKNNVEREVDTELAREQLEKLGYHVVRKEQETKSETNREKADSTEEKKSSVVKQNHEKAASKTEE